MSTALFRVEWEPTREEPGPDPGHDASPRNVSGLGRDHGSEVNRVDEDRVRPVDLESLEERVEDCRRPVDEHLALDLCHRVIGGRVDPRALRVIQPDRKRPESVALHGWGIASRRSEPGLVAGFFEGLGQRIRGKKWPWPGIVENQTCKSPPTGANAHRG